MILSQIFLIGLLPDENVFSNFTKQYFTITELLNTKFGLCQSAKIKNLAMVPVITLFIILNLTKVKQNKDNSSILLLVCFCAKMLALQCFA